MQSFTLAYLVGAAFVVLGAALIPVQQRQVNSSVSDGCGRLATTTVTEYVTSPPETVTIALEDPGQVSASIASVVSVESAYWSGQSELAPVSEPTITTTHVLTNTEIVPVIVASLTSSPGSVYFISVGPETTKSLTDYTPISSEIIGTTTITLAPVPSSNASTLTTTISMTTVETITTGSTATSTVHSASPILSTGALFTGPRLSNGWNSTSTTALAGATGASGATGSSSLVLMTTTNTSIILTTVNVTAAITPTSPCFDDYVYGSNYGYGSGYAPHSEYGTGLDKRQICTLVYATINGKVVSWCNNYFGSTVVETSYSTTYTPLAATSSAAPQSPPPPSSHNVEPSTSAPVSSTIPLNETPGPNPPSLTTSSSAPAATTSCGVSGAFVIGFDDLPAFSPADNDTAPFPPIFNPYEHLYWSNGWSYVPPPTEPFPPQNGTHLAEYIPSQLDNSTSGSPDAGDVPNGAIGAGPHNYDDAYWFNAVSAYIGCDNGDPSVTCDFVATGYKYDANTNQDMVVVTEHFPGQVACPGFLHCELTPIFFSSQFQGLSALSFYAVVQGQEVIFWIDTIEMAWWNNTCAAGLERISNR